MKIPIIYDAVLKAAIIEKNEIEQFANVVQVITGCSSAAADNFAIQVPPAQWDIAKAQLSEGMTIEQSHSILSDTLMFESWNLSLASKNLVRAVVGVPVIL